MELVASEVNRTFRGNQAMTQMLASVASSNEALVALELGADIIDLKNPHSGALGALPLATLEEIVMTVGGRRTLSATIGDTPKDVSNLRENILVTAATGVDIVKIGIATSRSTLAAWRDMPWEPISTRLVAVLFADEPLELDWINLSADNGFYGVMLDTADKRAGGLRSHCSDRLLREFVKRARENNLVCGLAGSLRIDDVSPLLGMAPDYLGFRGALCCGNSRVAQLDPDAFRAVRERIPRIAGNTVLNQEAVSAA